MIQIPIKIEVVIQRNSHIILQDLNAQIALCNTLPT